MRTSKSSWYQESEKTALLRSKPTGGRTGDELSVQFVDADVVTRLVTPEAEIWSGPWKWEATADGIPLTSAGSWEEVCWHSDKDVDYLELELPLRDGWRLQRQMLLARHDAFLLLADILLSPPETYESDDTAEPLEIHHSLEFSLSAGIRTQAEKESRELLLLSGKKRLALALPLALPEWRAEYAPGDLQSAGQTLQLKTAIRGKNLYAPLWIDLDPTRIRKPLTWRRLTVAQALEIQPRDVAVGYRVQVGAGQWLVYRSVADKGNRTVLGQNYATEFICCRFLANGETEDILEIE